jgi:hypothetical protein
MVQRFDSPHRSVETRALLIVSDSGILHRVVALSKEDSSRRLVTPVWSRRKNRGGSFSEDGLVEP